MAKKSEKAEKQQDKTPEVEESQKQEEILEDLDDQDKKEEGEEEIEEEPQTESTAEEKLAELQDRYLRLSAEYDNFRKRTLQSVDEAKDIEAVKEGMKLISDKFSSFLKQQGVREIEAINKEFDTDLHEAITKIPADSKKQKGRVVDVIQKGYFLNDRVLRFSKVVIGE